MKHVMIDLETFGTGPHACIVQVGACKFDPETGRIGARMRANIDANSAIESGAEMDPDTIYWWLKQSPEAIASITAEPKRSIDDVMNELNQFIGKDTLEVWSHATFDFSIVMNTLKRLEIKPLFSHKVTRDIRTLMALSKVAAISAKRRGTPHDALDDCMYQVAYCVKALESLKVGTSG